MKTEQLLFKNGSFNFETKLGEIADWVLVFGDRSLVEDKNIFDKIRKMYPKAYIMGCSSSGEIQDDFVSDGLLNVTAVKFEKSNAIFGQIYINDSCDFYEIGAEIAKKVERNGLKHIFILTDGVNMNGSRLVDGIKSVIGQNVPLTGGLAGDGANFLKTAVIANDYAKEKIIVYAAFYGDIKTGYASFGGWDTFGIERTVTKSKDNVLYEIDFKPALNLYKEYLGEKAKELPTSGLRFPLAFRHKNSDDIFVRSVLDVDEKSKSLIFRADIPEGAFCKLMKSNFNNLVSGSKKATELSLKMLEGQNAELAVVISCFGRKFLLKQRADEEIENIRDVLGGKAIITGFYSYGEIGPAKENSSCEMHNETITITLFSEM